MTDPWPESFDLLIERLRDNDLDAAEQEELVAELKGNPAARKRFARQMALSAALSRRLPSKSENVVPFPEEVPERSRPWLLVGVGLAASILLVLGTWFAFQAVHSSGPALAALGVARVVASVDAEWEGEAPDLRLPLGRGDYRLARGSADLDFVDGAKVSLSGPAAFTLVNANHIHLASGNLVAQIPDEALGFVVTSPQSEIVDLGTEFGLAVSGEGRTDIHVLDGLVEVLPPGQVGASLGVRLSEGQARRFESSSNSPPRDIPVTSREKLLGTQHVGDLGLRMLRGSVRLTDRLAAEDLRKKSVGRNWIDLIPEQRAVQLSEPIAVSIDRSGSYRDFENLGSTLGNGERVHSYLLHFRPNTLNEVRGVIRFDQPIVGILCTASHLYKTDDLFGISTVDYPHRGNSFRGLEPNGRPTVRNARETDPDWQPDEIIVSQDRHTLSVRTFANTERGYDQIRVLTLAPSQP